MRIWTCARDTKNSETTTSTDAWCVVRVEAELLAKVNIYQRQSSGKDIAQKTSLFLSCTNISFNVYFTESPWVLGENGETCNTVCSKTGRFCNQDEQSKITTGELLINAMLQAGHTCSGAKAIGGHRDYPGTPFSTGLERGRQDDCYYLTDGATSSCTGNDFVYHRALCYCYKRWQVHYYA